MCWFLQSRHWYLTIVLFPGNLLHRAEQKAHIVFSGEPRQNPVKGQMAQREIDPSRVQRGMAETLDPFSTAESLEDMSVREDVDMKDKPDLLAGSDWTPASSPGPLMIEEQLLTISQDEGAYGTPLKTDTNEWVDFIC